MKDFSYITNSHPSYIEGLYKDYVANPDSIDPDIRKFFDGFDFAISNVSSNGNGIAAQTATSAVVAVDLQKLNKEFSVYRLIQAYRRKGHLVAKTNPIRERKDRGANVDLQSYALTDADLPTKF